MENKTSIIATLAKNNINVLDVDLGATPNQLYIKFEFQWRDPKNRNHRWAKTVLWVHNTKDWSQELLNTVREARKELEQ